MLEVKTYKNKRGVYTQNTIINGDTILELKGIIKIIPCKYSIQISSSRHLYPDGEDEPAMKKLIWPYLNHSCSPNAMVNVNTLQLIALKNIEAGEEITFDYETTDWSMKEPFNCNCGSTNCRGEIKGELFFQHDLILSF